MPGSGWIPRIGRCGPMWSGGRRLDRRRRRIPAPFGEQSLVAGVGATEHALACSEAPLPIGLP